MVSVLLFFPRVSKSAHEKVLYIFGGWTIYTRAVEGLDCLFFAFAEATNRHLGAVVGWKLMFLAIRSLEDMMLFLGSLANWSARDFDGASGGLWDCVCLSYRAE